MLGEGFLFASIKICDILSIGSIDFNLEFAHTLLIEAIHKFCSFQKDCELLKDVEIRRDLLYTLRNHLREMIAEQEAVKRWALAINLHLTSIIYRRNTCKLLCSR